MVWCGVAWCLLDARGTVCRLVAKGIGQATNNICCKKSETPRLKNTGRSVGWSSIFFLLLFLFLFIFISIFLLSSAVHKTNVRIFVGDSSPPPPPRPPHLRSSAPRACVRACTPHGTRICTLKQVQQTLIPSTSKFYHAGP